MHENVLLGNLLGPCTLMKLNWKIPGEHVNSSTSHWRFKVQLFIRWVLLDKRYLPDINEKGWHFL